MSVKNTQFKVFSIVYLILNKQTIKINILQVKQKSMTSVTVLIITKDNVTVTFKSHFR